MVQCNTIFLIINSLIMAKETNEPIENIDDEFEIVQKENLKYRTIEIFKSFVIHHHIQKENWSKYKVLAIDLADFINANF